MLYETKFENRRKTVVNIFEYGKLLVCLQPGETRHVESRSPKTSYARWSTVTFSGDSKVTFDENKEWVWPFPDKLMLEFLNIDGTGTEGIRIGGEIYRSDRGIPRLIPVDLHDTAWCFVERVERKLVEHKLREGDFIIRKRFLEDVKTMRSRKEIRGIEKQLLDEATAKAKADVERQFLKPVETNANTE